MKAGVPVAESARQMDGSRAECWCKDRFPGRRKQEAVIAWNLNY